MSVNPTEIRVVGVVSGGDLAIATRSNNLRACRWGASRSFHINIAVNPTVFSQRSQNTACGRRTGSGLTGSRWWLWLGLS